MEVTIAFMIRVDIDDDDVEDFVAISVHEASKQRR